MDAVVERPINKFIQNAVELTMTHYFEIHLQARE
jgi:hypothetical protein